MEQLSHFSSILVICLPLLFLCPAAHWQEQDLICTKAGATVATLPSLSEGGIVPENKSLLQAKGMLFGIKSNGDILALDSSGTNFRCIKNNNEQNHKIFTFQNEDFAAQHIDLINNRVCYQDSFNGRYFVLDKRMLD